MLRPRISETRESGGNQSLTPTPRQIPGSCKMQERRTQAADLWLGLVRGKPGRVLMIWERPSEGLHEFPHSLLHALSYYLLNSYLLSSSCGQHHQMLEDLQLQRVPFMILPKGPFLGTIVSPTSTPAKKKRKEKRNCPVLRNDQLIFHFPGFKSYLCHWLGLWPISPLSLRFLTWKNGLTPTSLS